MDTNIAAFVIHKNQTGAQKLCEVRCMVEGWSCTSNKAMKPDCSVGFVKHKTLALLAKGYSWVLHPKQQNEDKQCFTIQEVK